MKFTKRDKLVLAAFAVLTIGVCVVVAKKMTSSGGSSRTATRASARGAAAAEEDRPSDKPDRNTSTATAEKRPVLPSRAYEEFAAIPERNLFRDLTAQEETRPVRAAPSVPRGPTPSPLPPPSSSGSSDDSKPEETVAVTGYMTMGDEKVILVENVTTKETQLAREGAEVFGYLVASVSPEGAMLRKGDDEQYFALGQGKPDEHKKEEKKDEQKDEKKGDESKKEEAKPTPSASPSSSPKMPSGIDWNAVKNMSPEERRRRYEEWRRSQGR